MFVLPDKLDCTARMYSVFLRHFVSEGKDLVLLRKMFKPLSLYHIKRIYDDTCISFLQEKNRSHLTYNWLATRITVSLPYVLYQKRYHPPDVILIPNNNFNTRS